MSEKLGAIPLSSLGPDRVSWRKSSNGRCLLMLLYELLDLVDYSVRVTRVQIFFRSCRKRRGASQPEKQKTYLHLQRSRSKMTSDFAPLSCDQRELLEWCDAASSQPV